jgi:uncharacterized protein YbjT (DUF2867 family)
MAHSFLIVGGTGTVGSEIARLLGQAGHSVRVTTRAPATSPDQARVDLSTGEGLDAAFAGVRRAFFLSPVGYPDQYPILAPLILRARQAGLEKVVLMTANGVEGNEAAPMRRAELDLERSGLAYNILRPTWFMQNFDTFWSRGIVEQGAIRLPAGRGKTAFVDARDIAAVAASLLAEDRFRDQAFAVTGPRALDHDEAARILSAASGKRIVYRDIDPAEFRSDLLEAGFNEAYADLLVLSMGFLKEGFSANVSDGVETVLGRPAGTLEAYARDYKDAW